MVDGQSHSAAQRSMLLLSAACALVAALFSVGTLEALCPEGWLAEDFGRLVTRGRALLIGLSFVLVLIAWRLPALGTGCASAAAVGLTILVGFEAVAGPFVGQDTTIFQRDEALGWRLRPGSHDHWLGADVTVNSLGMRGAEPREGVRNTVLFLGDSVIFGAFLERDAFTVPAVTEAALSAANYDAQCLNAGVGGWAPWQEELWFREVGGQLQAQIVLINLVLNDATEPVVLRERGGSREGFQRDRSREPGLLKSTTWWTALRRWRRQARGERERKQAEGRSALGVYELLRSPELPMSRELWAQHLAAVESLVGAVQAAGATPVIISHAYAKQFDVPGLWWPQEQMAAWCLGRNLLHYDPSGALREADASPAALFHDGVHLNREGAAVVGRGIAGYLERSGLIVRR